MKRYIWALSILAVLAIILLTGCGKQKYEETDLDKKPDEEIFIDEEATIIINGIGYYDWTVYTMGKGNKPEGGYNNEIVLSSMSDPKTFNPLTANETSSTTAFSGVFEGLTTQDGVTLDVVPLLAKSWEISDDGLVYTFHLHQNVKFNNGVPMTADDVVFSFNNLVYNENIPGVGMRDILKIKGKFPKVEKVDEYTVKITLPSKFAPFLRIVGGVDILPKHILQRYVARGEMKSTWNVNTDPKEIIGTGPYRITLYKEGQRLIQEPNLYYWRDGWPKIAKRIILIVPNIDTASLKFKSGETDNFTARGEDYTPLKNIAEKQDFSLYDCGGSAGTLFLTFNQNVLGVPKHKQVWFRDKLFRQAIAYALDKQRIIEEVYRGMAKALIAAEPASNRLFHNPNVRTYEYDPEKAKELLEEAGYRDYDGDGIREKPKGVPVSFLLTTNSGNNVREQSCQIITNDLKSIGLDVTFTPLEFNNLITKMNQAGDWHAMIMGLTGGVEPHYGFNVWRVDGRTHMYNQRPLQPNDERDWDKWEKGLRDWEHRIQEIFEEGIEELDPVKRKAIYDEWQEIVAEELPYIYLVSQKTIPAVRNKFKNLKPTAYGGIYHNIDKELEIVP